MRITPLSIKRQEFKRNIRGFDPDEVNTFLEIIADEVDQLIKKNDELSASANQMQKKLQDYQQIEKGLQQTLLVAQETSSRSMEASKRQAVLLIKEAEIKAKQLIDKAKADAKAIHDAVLELREQKQTIIIRLRALITAHMQMMNALTNSGQTELAEESKKEKTNSNIDSVIDRLI
ncbi:MAG: DivIVA domain-containing protein [Bacteroidetes bacterium]|nr:DivIVA domain-containing protein [Bacteroidota bacterium]MBU2584686.1 DivIVA domain-containing protein [Bacteroidota bacterium]